MAPIPCLGWGAIEEMRDFPDKTANSEALKKNKVIQFVIILGSRCGNVRANESNSRDRCLADNQEQPALV